ncbi:MAG: hypothetical protein AB3N33_07855 [Puniceicoccaceae bacterium]
MTNLRASLFILIGILMIVGFFSALIYLEERGETAYREGLKTAREALEAGQLEAAREQLEALVESDPEKTGAAVALFDTVAFFDRDRARQLLDILKERELEREKLLYRQIRFHVMESNGDAVGLLAGEARALQPRSLDGSLAMLQVRLFEGNVEEGLPLLVELAEAHPANRHLKFISAELFSLQESMLERIMAKDRFMDLLDQPDDYSFLAAVQLISKPKLPLFADDLRAVADHLEGHPYLDQGLAQLPIDAVRQLSDRLAGTAPDLAFHIGNQLIRRPDASLQDQLVYLYTGQAAGELDAVHATADSLLEKPTHDQMEAILLTRQLAMRGEYAKAGAIVEELLQSEPGSPVALELLVWLADNHFKVMPETAQAWLAEAIQRHPESSPAAWLLANGTLMTLRPADRDSLIRAAIRRYAGTELLALGRWLLQAGEAELVLELLPAETLPADPDAFLLHYQALLALKRYPAARQLLGQESLPLADWERDLLLARVHLLEENREACAALISQLIPTLPAAGRSNLFNLAEMARSIDSPALQRMAYERSYATGVPFPLQHAMTYLAMLLEARDLQLALRFTAFCRNLVPENLFYINNHCYMRLLAGREVEASIADMREVVEADPEFREFRLTLALAELIGGYPGQARETLEALGDRSDIGDPRSRLSIALVLAGSGELGPAREILDSIDTAFLMTEELELIDAYFREARTAEVAVRELPQAAIDLRAELEAIREALGADREALLLSLVGAEETERRASLAEWDDRYGEPFRLIGELSRRLRQLMEAYQPGTDFVLPDDLQRELETLRELRQSLEKQPG